jgi:hypothetical protein
MDTLLLCRQQCSCPSAEPPDPRIMMPPETEIAALGAAVESLTIDFPDGASGGTSVLPFHLDFDLDDPGGATGRNAYLDKICKVNRVDGFRLGASLATNILCRRVKRHHRRRDQAECFEESS